MQLIPFPAFPPPPCPAQTFIGDRLPTAENITRSHSNLHEKEIPSSRFASLLSENFGFDKNRQNQGLTTHAKNI